MSRADGSSGPDDGSIAEVTPAGKPTRVQRVRAKTDVARAKGEELVRRVEDARPRIPALDVTLDAVTHDRLAGGGLLAGALAFRLFLVLVPMALVLVVGLGFLSQAGNEAPERLAHDIGLTAFVADSVAKAADTGATGRWIALVAGGFALFWATRSLVKALNTIHQLAWHLPVRAMRGSAKTAARFLVGMVVFLLATSLVNRARDALPFPGGLIVTVLVVVVYGVGWLAASLTMPHRDAPWTALVPGAVLFGVAMQVVHLVTVLYFVNKVSHASETYGALGAAAGLLVWLFVLGRLAVVSAVLNATLWNRGHPETAAPNEPGPLSPSGRAPA